MLREEFENRTQVFLSDAMYTIVEEFYMDSDYDKDQFCEKYRLNEDGLAELIQKAADIRACKEAQLFRTAYAESELKAARLEEELEKELEWKEHLGNELPMDDIVNLCDDKFVKYMTDEEAADLIYDWFGFDKSLIRILHERPVKQVNRHGRIRNIGSAEINPLYCATDWNYIRFAVRNEIYELQNGELRRM